MANVKKKLLTHYIRQRVLNIKRADSYKRRHNNAANHIERFSAHAGKKIYTNDFTAAVMEAFIHYLRGLPKNYYATTVRGICQIVGENLRKAHKDGYAVDFSFADVQLPSDEPQAVYLTEEEIARIFNLKKLSPGAYAVRERFVIACCTGMRIGDVEKLDIKNFLNNRIILKTGKTGEKVIIPQHWMVREVLARNKNNIPTIRSQQSYNTAVKRLCKRAGVNEKILYERERGNRVVRKLVSKWSLVSSHTARRSFATNMYLRGIPAARIMLCTGHKTEQSFFKYIRIGKEENAKELENHPFFKKQ